MDGACRHDAGKGDRGVESYGGGTWERTAQVGRFWSWARERLARARKVPTVNVFMVVFDFGELDVG